MAHYSLRRSARFGSASAAKSAIFVFGALCLPASGSAQRFFSGIGDLTGGATVIASYARGIAADGNYVVGRGTSAHGDEALRFTRLPPLGAIIGLGDLAGGAFMSYASAASSDGSVMVGTGTSASGTEAFRWTQRRGMVSLGDLPGGRFSSAASGVSADGSVVVGRAESASGTEAFRWTQRTGMVGLGDPFAGGGLFASEANGVSADGSVVVGGCMTTRGKQAFRWTQAGGMVGLRLLFGSARAGEGRLDSDAFAVSADGSVVVGRSVVAGGSEAFRWTSATGRVALGDLPGGAHSSSALAVSADGTLAVGLGESASGREAVTWDTSEGPVVVMRTITAFLGVRHVSVPAGWHLTEAWGVAVNGLEVTIVGMGTNPLGQNEGWMARVPRRCC